MDKPRWSLTFQPHPTEDSPLRLIQAVRLIVTSSLRASSMQESRVVVSDADVQPSRVEAAPKEGFP